MSFFVAEDEALRGLENDWGDCLIFTCEEDREAAMKDYQFQKSTEKGKGLDDDEEEGFFDEEDNPS